MPASVRVALMAAAAVLALAQRPAVTVVSLTCDFTALEGGSGLVAVRIDARGKGRVRMSVDGGPAVVAAVPLQERTFTLLTGPGPRAVIVTDAVTGAELSRREIPQPSRGGLYAAIAVAVVGLGGVLIVVMRKKAPVKPAALPVPAATAPDTGLVRRIEAVATEVGELRRELEWRMDGELTARDRNHNEALGKLRVEVAEMIRGIQRLPPAEPDDGPDNITQIDSPAAKRARRAASE